MRLIVIFAAVHLAWTASIADITCPDSCTCQVSKDSFQISCDSYEFIKKLLPKQAASIVRLDLNNASLVNIDSKLKYLKNLQLLNLAHNNIDVLPTQFPYLPKLKILDLSHNNIKTVTLSQLPKNLEVLDLSHNSIAYFPKDFTELKELKTLHFHDNPIDCDCEKLSDYEKLTKHGILKSENLTCYNPQEFYGRLLSSINCSLITENFLNLMLGDEEASGEVGDVTDEDENLYIKANIAEQKEPPIEEGSGDEGSGMIPILPDYETPKACHFNCSTPKPIGLNDGKNASPPPSINEIFQDILEDFGQPEKVATVATLPEEKPQIVQKEVPSSDETSDKDLEKEVVTFPTNDTVVGEMEKASLENASTNTVYIVVGLLIALAAFSLIYYLNKRRNLKNRSRKRNKPNENGYGEEMKPLGKSAEKAEINSKLPENAPLLNGQNGKMNGDTRLPLNGSSDDFENVELRKPDKQELLTPQPERVTIIAAELPDSIPKTPLRVHRQMNSEGEMVTTAVN